MKKRGSKTKKIITGFILMAIVAVAVSALIPPVEAGAAKYKYLDEVLGISRDDVISWMSKHEHDKYYLGTPCRTNDNRNAYGDPYHTYGGGDVNGVPGFNCTGFVWRALYDSGANGKKIPLMGGCSNCWQNPKSPGANSWWHYIKGDAGFYPVYYKYKTVKELLAAGKAEKGDVIYMLQNGTPSPYSGITDSHVGIFWGDSPYDNKLWHSGPTTEYGNTFRNGINGINAGSPSTYYLIKFKPSEKSGWSKSQGTWSYYYLGKPYESRWAKIKNEWYYFKHDGKMKTGWHSSKSGDYYYLEENDSGKMVTGWKKIKGIWSYFESNGKAVNGWQKIKGKWYYFKNYEMQTGWLKKGGKTYCLGSNGAMKTGWVKIKDSWYRFDSSGVMKTGWYKEKGKWYYFDKVGKMATGTQKIGSKTYRFRSNGSLIE